MASEVGRFIKAESLPGRWPGYSIASLMAHVGMISEGVHVVSVVERQFHIVGLGVVESWTNAAGQAYVFVALPWQQVVIASRRVPRSCAFVLCNVFETWHEDLPQKLPRYSSWEMALQADDACDSSYSASVAIIFEVLRESGTRNIQSRHPQAFCSRLVVHYSDREPSPHQQSRAL